jgi:hypothetical protein
MADDFVVATIVVTRTFGDDGSGVCVDASTTSDDTLDLVEALGMLELAKAVLLEDVDEDEA